MIEILSILLFFSVILACANRAEQERFTASGASLATIIAYGSAMLIHLLLIVIGAGAQAFGFLLNTDAGRDIINDPSFVQTGITPDLLASINFNLIGAGMWVPSVIGLILLVPAVRRALEQVIPITPRNHVHAISLSFAMLIFPNLFVTLGVGLDTLTEMMIAAEAAGGTSQNLIGTTWAQNLGFFVMSFVGVGWLTRRSWSESSERLKLELPSLREVGVGIGAGLVALVVLAGVTAVTDALGLGDATVDALSEELYGPFFSSIAGVLTVGLAAAWGEEALFRGAIQPRFGRILTAFLFAIVHGNYGISVVTLAIFALGYMLGYLRDRYNTTTAMVTHATFNSAQALIAYLAIQAGAI